MAKKKAKTKKKTKKHKPRANGTVGRNTNGQFAKGHAYSKGNKSHTNEPAKKLKQALIDAISEQDIENIAKALKEKALEGDVQAANTIFDRLWGKAMQAHEIEHAGNITVVIE